METSLFTGPLEEMVKKFLLVIPNIAAAIAILVVGYIIARILKAVAVKGLTSTKLMGKVEEMKIPEKERPVEIIGRLTFYFVMLFVLLAFFNVLNLRVSTQSGWGSYHSCHCVDYCQDPEVDHSEGSGLNQI